MQANDNTDFEKEAQEAVRNIIEKDKAAGWLLKGERPKKSRVKSILAHIEGRKSELQKMLEQIQISEEDSMMTVLLPYDPKDFIPVSR